MAQIIYTAKPKDGAPLGSLFAGKKLFLTQKTPSRSHFIDLIRANGGEVVRLEKSADIVIADDARKEVVPGSYSWKWIDNSIKNGALEDLDNYLAGPPVGMPRPISSITRPASNSRNGYTAEDDRVLLEWVQAHAQKGSSIAGNETYKQLESQHPRHTWQSWRDRWVKTLRFRAPPRPTPQEAALTPRGVNDARSSMSSITPKEQTKKLVTPNAVLQKPANIFTDEDINTLRALTPTILEIRPERQDEAWNEWAQLHPEHSAQRWRNFWRKNILPIARHSSGGIIIEEEETASQGSTPVTSPSLHTQSSHAVRKASPTSSQSRAKEAPTLVSATKRKRSVEESDGLDIPSSPPIMPRRLSLTMDSPHQKRAFDMQEVPSTPESEQPITSQSSQLQATPFVKDTFDEVEHHSIEAEEFLGSGREVTPTLSEPQTSRRSLATSRSVHPGRAEMSRYTAEDELTINSQLKRSGQDAGNTNNVSSLDLEDDGTEYQSNVQITYPVLSQWEGMAAEDTQAILREEVQAFDFDLPEPEEGWQAFQSPPPPMRLSSQRSKGKGKEKMKSKEEREMREPALPNNDEELTELGAWIDAKLARGYSMADIRKAMTATTMNFDLANDVLRHLRRTGRIPTHTPGVWTPSDDEKIATRDAREIRTLQEKHGNERFDQRWEFLQTCQTMLQNDREDQRRSYEG